MCWHFRWHVVFLSENRAIIIFYILFGHVNIPQKTININGFLYNVYMDFLYIYIYHWLCISMKHPAIITIHQLCSNMRVKNNNIYSIVINKCRCDVSILCFLVLCSNFVCVCGFFFSFAMNVCWVCWYENNLYIVLPTYIIQAMKHNNFFLYIYHVYNEKFPNNILYKGITIIRSSKYAKPFQFLSFPVWKDIYVLWYPIWIILKESTAKCHFTRIPYNKVYCPVLWFSFLMQYLYENIAHSFLWISPQNSHNNLVDDQWRKRWAWSSLSLKTDFIKDIFFFETLLKLDNKHKLNKQSFFKS